MNKYSDGFLSNEDNNNNPNIKFNNVTIVILLSGNVFSGFKISYIINGIISMIYLITKNLKMIY